ncbi:MAG: hypothetical protein EZS28_042489, partial [Streblomastix strix]
MQDNQKSNRDFISRCFANFQATGSIEDLAQKRRPRSVLVNEKDGEALAGFQNISTISYMDQAKNSESSKIYLLRPAGGYSYNSQRLLEKQVLSKNNMMEGHQFCLKMLETHAGNPRFIIKIRFFDECYFKLGGSLNTKNMFNSVVCAGGGVKGISDITANYYNKSETYSQTETNNLLNNKANTGVSYTKGEDDAL